MKQLQANLRDWITQSIGLPENFSLIVVAVVSVAAVILFALAIDRLVGWLIRTSVPWIVGRFSATKHTQWLDALRERFVASRSAHILAVLAAYWMIPLALDGFPETLTVVRNLIEGYLIFFVVIAINSLLGASGDVLVDDELPTGVSLRFATQGA